MRVMIAALVFATIVAATRPVAVVNYPSVSHYGQSLLRLSRLRPAAGGAADDRRIV